MRRPTYAITGRGSIMDLEHGVVLGAYFFLTFFLALAVIAICRDDGIRQYWGRSGTGLDTRKRRKKRDNKVLGKKVKSQTTTLSNKESHASWEDIFTVEPQPATRQPRHASPRVNKSLIRPCQRYGESKIMNGLFLFAVDVTVSMPSRTASKSNHKVLQCFVPSTRYSYCGPCCYSRPDSVCKAHGTGYQAAVDTVDNALKYMYYEVDISYSNLTKTPPRLTELGTDVVLYTLCTYT